MAHTDTSSADTNITAATQIDHADTSSADTNITAATQITHTDTSSANANITAATQINHTDTSSANANITATTTGQLHTLSGPLLMHSPLWRALRRSHANGCGRLRTVADGFAHRHNFPRTQPLTPTPPNETGTLATHSGKSKRSNDLKSATKFFQPSHLHSRLDGRSSRIPGWRTDAKDLGLKKEFNSDHFWVGGIGYEERLTLG